MTLTVLSALTATSLAKKSLAMLPKVKTLKLIKSKAGFYCIGKFTNGDDYTTSTINAMSLTQMTETQWLRAIRDAVYEEHPDARIEKENLDEERYGKSKNK